MQEGRVTCASVQFKNSLKPPAASASASASASADTRCLSKGDLSQTTTETQSRWYQILAWCAGSLCVLLLLAVIRLIDHMMTLHGDLTELRNNQNALMRLNQNLTGSINNLNSANENLTNQMDSLRSDGLNQKVQIDDLTRGYAVLEKNNTDLSADNQMLKATNINFTKQIEKLQEEKRELTFTVAQETIDDYCPKTNGVRQCAVCPRGWIHYSKSCYGVIDELDRSWEEARQDCREKNSDLAVIESADELAYMVRTFRWFYPSVTKGSWIGLEVSDGSWKWVDGTPVDVSWTLPPPVHAHCGYFYLESPSIATGSCDREQRWICEKKSF